MLSPRIPVIYGAAAIGAPGTFCALTNTEQAQRVVDALFDPGVEPQPELRQKIISLNDADDGHGDSSGLVREPVSLYAIDTSNVHTENSCFSFQILAQMDLHGCVIDTKFYPLVPGDHARVKLREAFDRMLASLGDKRVRVLYLNAPDHATPFSETFAAMDELHKEGKFEMLGLSNYRTHEVGEIVTLCRANGWVVPAVYQGLYNAIDRMVESELLPCLRQFGIKFAAYGPLAGGYLVGDLLFEPEPSRVRLHLDLPPSAAIVDHLLPSVNDLRQSLRGSGRHFDSRNPFSAWYQSRYLNSRINNAVFRLCAVLKLYGLSLHEASLRWLQHHSALVPSDLGMIFGGRTPDQVKQTLTYCTYGPLPDVILEAFEECYTEIRGGLPGFWMHPAWDDRLRENSQ
ncbi:Aflatoxin B1-aldehyde reductase [Mycena indigotica]|uniref:Aflatoxin B1-aldehyde reductase n=1 Tax=Mycena indigotica TaxID=2126181 RepID=A0A8H6S005_9AGAR|nr:Aflatoxin B1-aldehyde reductase [Mycena indigotica]KAF7289725.1 Aflatoxin B1-aldehyde reductase [Mycena indigotica]